jgi:hypothetical protein
MSMQNEASSSTVWQTVQPKYVKRYNRIGRTEMLQSTDPVSTTNRFDKLSDLPDHVLNSDVSLPRSNRRTDSTTNAANTRIKSQRYMFKQSTHHDYHHSIQQETLLINMEKEDRSHQSGSSVEYQLLSTDMSIPFNGGAGGHSTVIVHQASKGDLINVI